MLCDEFPAGHVQSVKNLVTFLNDDVIQKTRNLPTFDSTKNSSIYFLTVVWTIGSRFV